MVAPLDQVLHPKSQSSWPCVLVHLYVRKRRIVHEVGVAPVRQLCRVYGSEGPSWPNFQIGTSEKGCDSLSARAFPQLWNPTPTLSWGLTILSQLVFLAKWMDACDKAVKKQEALPSALKYLTFINHIFDMLKSVLPAKTTFPSPDGVPRFVGHVWEGRQVGKSALSNTS